MFYRCALLAAAAAIFLNDGARADSLKPFEGRDIDLGSMVGTVYYSADTEPFRVVATLQTVGESPLPVRFIATLSPGQVVILSTPRGVDEPALEVSLVRRGDQVVVEPNNLARQAQAMVLPARR